MAIVWARQTTFVGNMMDEDGKPQQFVHEVSLSAENKSGTD